MLLEYDLLACLLGDEMKFVKKLPKSFVIKFWVYWGLAASTSISLILWLLPLVVLLGIMTIISSVVLITDDYNFWSFAG